MDEDIEGGVDREQAVKMCLAGRGWSREHANGRAWKHGIGRAAAERPEAFRAQMIFKFQGYV
ncbi:hypothetical protein N7489_010358 [Penicillium chrysogenum]|uniref:Uncharacterized protein n=1 Tax=Penicillium chrysogenum TaxID=5076 RepID=A0ABQ8WTV2_PENCH|nr:uncharacterized protein N7489_010358 [Penicillium chrysogenum]KAJ5229650.1 hypothetical protein N7489_010358 [Penicillium chrysogenum]KAJ5282464.1 hypothetical protein N7505_000444 [Penicillium chrysogenum]KAJ6169530.1 hypothetical protein N7497_002373 [Penicillium chrysogenum]